MHSIITNVWDRNQGKCDVALSQNVWSRKYGKGDVALSQMYELVSMVKAT